jgi:hypothetical protein
VAKSVLAKSGVGAIAGAGLDGAVSTTELALAVAGTVVAGSLSVAVSRALEDAAVSTTVSAAAVAGKVTADSVSGALVGAGAGGTVWNGLSYILGGSLLRQRDDSDHFRSSPAGTGRHRRGTFRGRSTRTGKT